MIPSSRFKRFIAFCVDVLISQVVTALLTGILFYSLGFALGLFVEKEYLNNLNLPELGYRWGGVVGFLITLFYYVLFESSKYQATLGKKLFNLYVSDLCDHKLTFGRALFRYILWILPTLPIVYVQITSKNMTDYTTRLSNDWFLMLIWSVFIIIWIIPIFFTKEKTTLYDMLSSTRVNKKSKSSCCDCECESSN